MIVSTSAYKKILNYLITIALIFILLFCLSLKTSATTELGITAYDVNSISNPSSYSTHFEGGKNSTVIVPITIEEPGLLLVDLKKSIGAGEIKLSLHTEVTCDVTTSISTFETMKTFSSKDDFRVNVQNPGIYYLRMKAEYDAKPLDSISYSAKLYPSYNILPLGKKVYGSNGYATAFTNEYATDYVIQSVTSTGNGYITLTMDDFDNNRYRLVVADADGNILLGEQSVNRFNDSFTFGVKRGEYFIAVFGGNRNSFYSIKASQKRIYENSGSTKKSAKLLSTYGQTQGIITVDQIKNTADWYKFKISKTSFTTFSIKTKITGTNGKLKFSVYNKKGKLVDTYNAYSRSNSFHFSPANNGTKLKAGTYYLKISRTGDANGYYSIRW